MKKAVSKGQAICKPLKKGGIKYGSKISCGRGIRTLEDSEESVYLP